MKLRAFERRLIAAAIFLGVTIVAPAAAQQNYSTAYKLAVLAAADRNGVVHPDDQHKWQQRLDRLTYKCDQEKEERVGDMIVASHNILNKSGHEKSYEDVAWMVDASMPPGHLTQSNCAEVFATVITREQSGQLPLRSDPTATR
jgi:phage-related baseplate assembly protein